MCSSVAEYAVAGKASPVINHTMSLVETIATTTKTVATAAANATANATANSTKSSNSISAEFIETMTIVSLSCNIFTLMLSFVLIYRLAMAIKMAKKNREIKRKKLYFYSILVVSLNFV